MERTKRAGRRRLDADMILAASQAIVDRDGAPGLTTRTLGAELGADPTAIYRHFRDKDELLLALADRLLGEVLEGFVVDDDWRETLMALASRSRDVYLAHPGFARLLAQAPDVLPNHERIVEVALGALRRSGLTDREAALAFHSMSDLVIGAASLEAESGFAGGVYEGWRRTYAQLPGDRFPNTTALAPHLFPDADTQFRFAMTMLLAGIGSLAQR
jgi:TetR/AcrR family tetracycline transcriptional repressor